ncbi:hypothetical protein A3J77_02265 [Candidatus Wolfebacteria bacterium RBG_13_41_7]|uniref:Uncharacterized protein n=1 Tax=Candidatus Wolfebacteria bacterium RBG_13_41_7 TaxID=1802554 RepID=A0A1F8DLQ3_9BACT|nr:MAG: hypothetical protein A3J77_02265 [Candidatus Wolfebacteria bacterium RBG_13_41_7]
MDLPTDGVSLDRSKVKIIILAFFGVVFSFTSGFFLQVFMLNGGGNNLLLSSMAALGFMAEFVICVFFIKTGWILNLAVFIQSLAFFALFYDRLSVMVGVGAAIGFLFFISGIYAGRSELENTLEIKFWKISKKALPKTIAGIGIFAGVVCASFINIDSKDFFIPRDAFNAVVAPITDSGLLEKIVPGFDFTGSTEETIRSIAMREIENNPQLKLLPDSIKEELLGKAVQEVKNQATGLAGTQLNFQNKLSDTIYDFLAVKFYSLPENILNSTPILIAIFIFLVIISLVWPIRLAAAFISFLLYETLLALGFGAIILEGRSKENIILK